MIFFFLLPWQTIWIYNSIPVEGQDSPFTVLGIYLVELILLGVLVFARSASAVTDSRVARTLAVVILLYCFVSIFLSTNFFLSFFQFLHVLFAVLLFLLLLDFRMDMKRISFAFLLGLIPVVMLGVYQFIYGDSPAVTLLGLAAHHSATPGDAVLQSVDGIRRLRAYGSFSHPNIFGGYLAVASVVAVYLLGQYKGWRKHALILFSLIIVTGLLVTVSRSAIIGLLLACVAGSVLLIGKRWQRLSKIFAFSIVILGIASALAVNTFGTSLRPGSSEIFEQQSQEERVVQYADFFPVLGNSWGLGSGLATYPIAYAEAVPGKTIWEYQPIHNVPLLIIAELGIGGVLLILLWMLSIDLPNIHRFPNKEAVFAFMMGTVLLFISFFDHYLWTSWSGLALTAFVMAMTVRLGREEKKNLHS